jgi:hypothetical protein
MTFPNFDSANNMMLDLVSALNQQSVLDNRIGLKNETRLSLVGGTGFEPVTPGL